MAKLTLGQEAYYEQQVAEGLDDYFAGRGESPGLWAGSAAEALGLAGVVGEGDLGKLLRGLDPARGTSLRAPARERTITVRTLALEAGTWRQERKRLAPVSGFDLVFSCPKSVSLLHALSDEERVRRQISEAHESAWQAALAYLEREGCVVRRGHAGAVRERGQGFVAAAFRHRTSRAQDPHLHTHVIVANMAQGADGTWRALDGEAILRTYRLATGYLYEAQLRHELTRRLGLTWTQPLKGMAELEQVPEEAVRAFSSRRRSIVEHMEALGTDGFAAARVAALATREAKEQVELPLLRERWRVRAAEHGLGRRELRRLARARPRPPALAIDHEKLAELLLSADGLTATRATFTLPQLVCLVAGALPDGASVEQVLEHAERLSRLPELERLEPGEIPGRPPRFTTRDLLQVEHEALELALAGRNVDAPSPERTLLARTLMQAGAGLSGEQRMLVHEAASRRDRVVCVIGAAGAGKTTALRLLADVYRESGLPVLGAAASGRAADELAHATAVRADTLHRLLLDARATGGLPRRCLLLVDEAGMADTRVLAPLLGLLDEADGKAILVGDPRQLPAVGAGGLYEGLCERLGAIELTDNRRQRDLGERRALARLREGEPEPYLAHAARNGRLHLDDDPIAARQQLLADWWQHAQHDLQGTLMLAHRRDDVRELNEAARTLLTRAGRLGDTQTRYGERELRIGDRVLCRRNDTRLGVRNGTRATVVDLDHDTVMLRSDTGALRHVTAGYAADHLDHGYAITGHAAQGATVNRAFVLLPDHGALREWGYVACTRARAETRLYLASVTHERDVHGRYPAEGDDRAGRVARALTTPAAEPLASDQSWGTRYAASIGLHNATLDHAEQGLAQLPQRELTPDRDHVLTINRVVRPPRLQRETPIRTRDRSPSLDR